jgi:hypothetical protein
MFLKDGLGDHDLFSHSLFILTARSLFFKKKKKKKKQKVKIKKKDKVKGGGECQELFSIVLKQFF